MTTTPHPIQAFDPRTGRPVGEPIAPTKPDELDQRAVAAHRAHELWASSRADRAQMLDSIATALDEAAPELVPVADAESALGVDRLAGELARTTGQLRMFAGVVRDGGFLDAVLSPADGGTGRPDVRRMLFPIGPVAVYAASNFPFAFSVAGGDTASALAAGCSVVVKAHDGHPQTSAHVGRILASATHKAGAPEGLVSLVFGLDAGAALVQHPMIKAAAFTGSTAGGRALFDLAARRPDPIPFYGELGSVNPVVVLPAAAAARAGGIASGYTDSLALGGGQFCTNPGLMFVPEGVPLLDSIAAAVSRSSGAPMLTARMRDAYTASTEERDDSALGRLASGTAPAGPWSVVPRAWAVTLDEFAASLPELCGEVFGPAGLVVTYPDVDALTGVLARLEGNLTATIHAEPSDYPGARAVTRVLRPRVGRLIFNGWPTGVSVCWAMHHGGPWPSTTSPAHTSVGARAIGRWLTPTAFQAWPDELLPEELREANPQAIPRTVDPS